MLIENGGIRFPAHNGGNKGSRRGTLAAEATGQRQRRGTLNGHLPIKDCWCENLNENVRKKGIERRSRKERSPSNDCSKTISKKIHLTFFLSFRNPPRIITRSFPFSLPSRSISLFNFHDRATRFRRESSSFPPCLRLAV